MFYSMKPVNRSQLKLYAIIAITFLNISCPLVLGSNSWAKTSTDRETEVFKLVEKLKSNDEWEWIKTTEALGKIGQLAVPNLIKALKTPEWQVRLGASWALSQIGQPAVSDLAQALEDPNKQVRRSAAFALETMGKTAKEAVPALGKALQDKDPQVCVIASRALKGMGVEAKAAVPQLMDALKNSDNVAVRQNAVHALKNIGPAAKIAIPQLINIWQNPNEDKIIRRYAVWALGEMGSSAKVAVPQFTYALQDIDAVVRQNAAYALGNIGAEAQTSVPELIAALKETNQSVEVRRNVVKALGKIGKLDVVAKNSKDKIVDALIEALKDKDTEVRRRTAEALGNMGMTASKAVLELSEALKDSDENVRNTVIVALGAIAFRLQEQAHTLSLVDLTTSINDLHKALEKLEDPELKIPKEVIAIVRLPLKPLETRLLLILISCNPWVWGTGIYLISLGGIFWIRPLWLLKIDDLLKPLNFKIPILKIEISPRSLLFLKYHPRVLDYWVMTHLKSVQDKFREKDTVQYRDIYVPIPVILNDQIITQFIGKDLCSTFKKNLLIWGEGGIGKTSLACQIAKWAMSDNESERFCHHRMLPVLIEDELTKDGVTSQQPFIAAIQGHLQDLSGEAEVISEELLERLLRQRRILVIVDHFSEMSEDTRKAIHPEMPNFPVNALIVTSRTEESLGHITKTTWDFSLKKPLSPSGSL
jgi:HEAT repeat protein